MKIASEHQNEIVSMIWPGYILTSTTNLNGGSAQVYLLEVSKTSEIHKYVLRVHGDYDFALNNNVAHNEFRVLQILEDRNYPAPRPIYIDDSNAIIERPYLLQEYIDAQPVTDDSVAPRNIAQQSAEVLARLHGLELTDDEISSVVKHDHFARTLLSPDHRHPGYDSAPQSSQDLHESIRAQIKDIELPNENKIVHGDYWPANTLWQKNELVCVIDWEDASIGNSHIDVGNARLELTWMYGEEIASEFTEFYGSLRKVDQNILAYADLFAVLRLGLSFYSWGLTPSEVGILEAKTEVFTDNALQLL